MRVSRADKWFILYLATGFLAFVAFDQVIAQRVGTMGGVAVGIPGPVAAPPGGGIVPTNKENNFVATTSPIVTGSLTWTAGARGIVAVASSATGAGSGSSHTVTGGTTTWNVVGTVIYGSRRRITVLMSAGTPTNGTLSIAPAFPETDYQESQYSVDQITGFNATTPNDTAITGSASSGTSLNLADVGTIDAGDVVYAAFGFEGATDGLAPATGLTTHILRQSGTNVRSLLIGTSTTDDTPGVTWTTSGNTIGGVAFVINIA
jgi:hypothetical protein